MEQMVQQSGVRTLTSNLHWTWLQGLFDRPRSAYLRLISRFLNSKSMRSLILRECTEEIHYKERKIETAVFSDGFGSWQARHTVWPTMDGAGEGISITTVGLSAYNEGEALALAIEEMREMIDSRLI